MENTFEQADALLVEEAQRTARLITKYLKQELSPASHDELDKWVAESDSHMRLFEELTDELVIQEGLSCLENTNKSKMLKKLKKQLRFKRPRFRFIFFQWAV